MVKKLMRRLLGETVRSECRSMSRRKRCRLGVELLEARCLLSSDPFRSITGSGNNLANPTWGQAGCGPISSGAHPRTQPSSTGRRSLSDVWVAIESVSAASALSTSSRPGSAVRRTQSTKRCSSTC